MEQPGEDVDRLVLLEKEKRLAQLNHTNRKSF